EIDATIESLNVLGLLEPIDDSDKTQFTQIAAKVLPLHPGWQSIRLVDTTMNVLASSEDPGGATKLVHPDWAERAIATGAPSVSYGVKDPATGQWFVTIGVPVYRDRRVNYVLGVRIATKMFSELL